MRTTPSPFAPLTPLAYHILAALKARPLHAYAILGQVTHDSGGSVTSSTGSLTHALKYLQSRRLIEPINDEPDDKLRYRLTSLGEQAFEQELRRLKQAVTIGLLAQKGIATWN